MFKRGDRVRLTAKEIAWRKSEEPSFPNEVLGTVTKVRKSDGMIAVKFDDKRLACDRLISSTGCGDWWQTSDEIELVEEGAPA